MGSFPSLISFEWGCFRYFRGSLRCFRGCFRYFSDLLAQQLLAAQTAAEAFQPFIQVLCDPDDCKSHFLLTELAITQALRGATAKAAGLALRSPWNCPLFQVWHGSGECPPWWDVLVMCRMVMYISHFLKKPLSILSLYNSIFPLFFSLSIQPMWICKSCLP